MINKNLTILTICQVFSFTAPPITVFISGIVGLKISPISSLATLPTSLSIVGTAFFSFFAAKIMSKIGRKKGFILSSTYSSLASLLGAYAIYSENFILFCFSCFIIGTGIAFTHQYRFAAAETVEKNDSSRAISILLLATILSALIGPNVANFTKFIASIFLKIIFSLLSLWLSISKPIGLFCSFNLIDRLAKIFPLPQPISKILEFLSSFTCFNRKLLKE